MQFMMSFKNDKSDVLWFQAVRVAAGQDSKPVNLRCEEKTKAVNQRKALSHG